jgi:hypothetical protein
MTVDDICRDDDCECDGKDEAVWRRRHPIDDDAALDWEDRYERDRDRMVDA